MEDDSGTLVVESAKVAESESVLLKKRTPLKGMFALRFCPTWWLRQSPGAPMRHGPMCLK